MDEIKELKTMLKAVLNGQHTLRSEMHEKFENVDKEFEKVHKEFDEVNKRLDAQGMQLAYLDDDAPTRRIY